MFIAEIFHLFHRIEMQEDNAKSLASTIEHPNIVARVLIDDLTIDILCYLFINRYSLKRTSNIAMQNIVHIASGKRIHVMTEKIGLFAHGSLYVGLDKVDAESIAELNGYHIASCTRAKFKEMYIVILIKNNLNVEFSETDVQCGHYTL